MPNWLRWILVLPVALLSYFAIQVLVGIQSDTLPLPGSIQDLWSQGVNSVVGPWAFVFVGAKMAPPPRAFETAVTLGVVYGMFTGAVAILALLNSNRVHNPLWLTTAGALGVLAVIGTCLHFRVARQSKPSGHVTTAIE